MPHPRGQLLADRHGARSTLLNISAAQRMLQAAGLSFKKPLGERSKPQGRILGKEGRWASREILIRGKGARRDETVDETTGAFVDHENTYAAPSLDIDDDVKEAKLGESVERDDDDSAWSLDMDADELERTLSDFSTEDNDDDASSLGIDEDVLSDYGRDIIEGEKQSLGGEDDALSLDADDDDALSMDIDEGAMSVCIVATHYHHIHKGQRVANKKNRCP